MMKKVLYVITKADTGGAQKYVRNLATHLDPERFEAKILYGGSDLTWLSNDVRWWMLFANDFLAIAELVRAFRRERPDVIHLNSSKAGVLGSFAAGIYKLINSSTHQLKTVFTSHGWVFNPTNYVSLPVRWCYIWLHKIAAHFQNVIINVSEYDRQLALRFRIAPATKLITIHNGIDPNIPFLSREEARKEIIRRLPITNYPACADGSCLLAGRSAGRQLPITGNWIGSIGRLTREKDYDTLIAAAAEVPDAYFFIIGSGPEQNYLITQLHNYHVEDRFFLVPPTGDDAKLLKAFDAFALSSIKEGLPYTLLEAKAAGLPCAVTNAGGMPEAVESPRDAVVPQRDPAALAAAITHVLKTKLPARRARANQFSLGVMVQETEKIYQA